MPGSTNSYWSRQSSPGPSFRFDPFLILDAHAEHYQSSNIIELPDSNRIFCPVCLELRSSEVESLELEVYHKYVGDLFEVLDRYGEETNFRKVILSMLDVILPKRSFVPSGDDQFHRILRILYKFMKSDLYNQNEFVSLAKIMSGISIDSLQPVPLRAAWEAWTFMLEDGEKISFSNLIDQNSQHVPENLTKFHIGQAVIVKSYLSLINHVAVDMKSRVSELVYFPQGQRESIHSKYFDASQTRCLKFTQDLLIPNCECYLLRQNEQSPLELQVTSEVFGALNECFINATRRKDEKFLDWLLQKDVIAILHNIFAKNRSRNYRSNLYIFIKTFVQHYIEKDYGELNELRNFLNALDEIETMASAIDQLDGNEKHGDIYIFYLLLNWVSIQLRSRYFVASRVRKVLTRRSNDLERIRQRIKNSRLFMRIFAFVAAHSLRNPTEDNEVTRFLNNDWREMLRDRTLSVFRYIYCHEPTVFEWAHTNENFLNLNNCDSIDYLINRGMKRNNLISTLTILLEYPALRAVFCRYIKRFASSFFEKLIPMGTNGIDRTIINEFSGWLPALLQEALLRYMNNPERRDATVKRIISLLVGINLLLADAQKSKFNPYFDEQFVIDFAKSLEITYKPNRSVSEDQLLVTANQFMALLIKTNNPCVLKLIQYIDFTLVGYMYHILNNYKIGDHLGDAVAHVLVAYDNLDYPLDHRIERTLYPMSSSAYEWMMSRNPDLHALSIILMDKVYPGFEVAYFNHRMLSNSAKACLVTGFLHMLCSNPEMVDNRAYTARLLRILKFEDFKYHPLYKHLMELAPNLEEEEDCRDDFESLISSPDLSFESADQFEEEQISVSRILDQLNEDEGYRSATMVSLPRNIYLNRAIDEQASSFSGISDWERRAYEATQTSSPNTQNGQT